MLDRTGMDEARRHAALVTGLSSRGALALDSVTLPFDNGERPLVRYPQKRPMIGPDQPAAAAGNALLHLQRRHRSRRTNAFYVRYHLADVPLDIDPDKFTLEVKGKVDKPAETVAQGHQEASRRPRLVAVNQCSGQQPRIFQSPRCRRPVGQRRDGQTRVGAACR